MELTKIVLCSLLLLSVVLTSCSSNPSVCFPDETCVSVEVADENLERMKGLMFRDVLPKDEGMLFIFPREGVYTFWMQNVNFAIDMIWLNSDQEIIYVEHQAPPCVEDPCPTYGPNETALYVLEVQSGLCEEIGCTKGDTLVFNLKNS